MAEGDGGVGARPLVGEQDRERSADEHRTADDDDVLPAGSLPVAREQLLTPWGVQGTAPSGVAAKEAAEVEGMQAVDVLAREDGVDDGLFVDLRRDGIWGRMAWKRCRR